MVIGLRLLYLTHRPWMPMRDVGWQCGVARHIRPDGVDAIR
jgi:hypothetical protein